MHELYKLEGPLKEKGDEQLIEDWFYFSSRERHTRWNCDWSSDVCSSDLLGNLQATYAPGLDFRSVFTDPAGNLFARTYASSIIYRQISPGVFTNYLTLASGLLDVNSSVRSEERRVGKECRSGWWSLGR